MTADKNEGLRKELLDDFYAECDELIGSLRSSITALEQSERGGETEAAKLEELFRAMHSLKGICAIVGLRSAEELAHAVEDLLRSLTKRETRLSPEALDLLMIAVERLDKIAAAFRAEKKLPSTADILPRLKAALRRQGAGENSPLPEKPASSVEKLSAEAEALRRGLQPWRGTFLPSPALDQKGININTVREQLGLLGEILEAKPAVIPGQGLSFSFLLGLRKPPANLTDWAEKGVTLEPVKKSPANQTAAKAESDDSSLSLTPSHFVRVDLSQLDDLMRITGEIIIHRSRLEDRLGHRQVVNDDLKDIDLALARSLRELRTAVSRVRLVPVAEIFSRMPYVVRDLARDSTKQVQVLLEGEQTEIDKYLVERLKEPLLHLVRNAFAHALETPAERATAGKPPTGTIRLRADRVGEAVEIQIADDGRGIDAEAVAARATSMGLTFPPLVDGNRILQVICQPGFSTREAADRAAGRGVGMAVVWNTIRELNGNLRLETKLGRGTTFTLRLPLTLSIADALILSVGAQTCALPQAQVDEIIQVPAAEIRTIKTSEVVPYRGGLLPLVRLRKMFGVADVANGSVTLVVVNSERGSTGLMVDRVQGKREIVIRPLADPLVHVAGISGATELGDGRPILILDSAVITAGVVRPPTASASTFIPMEETVS